VHDVTDLVGFRALGRHGELGVVVRAESQATRDAKIAIRGGASAALLYLVPRARVYSIQATAQTLRLDVDLADFVPSLLPDGTVELQLDLE